MKSIKKNVFFLLSVLFFVLGITAIITRQIIFDFSKTKLISMEPKSLIFKVLKENVMPLKLQIYFFNWTNPEEISNPDVKLNLKEIGPFEFSETKKRVNVVWNENKTMSFDFRRTWYYNEFESAAKLKENITTINPMILVSKHISDWIFF